MYDVIVVGAGAAGLLAAGTAAEKGKKVLVLEKMERAGRKLLITGKGRCNITNNAYASEHFKQIYPNGKFLKHAYKTYFTKDIVQLLASFGVETAVERGNRVFPKSNSAADIVKALLQYIKKHGVFIKYQSTVKKLIFEKNKVAGVILMSGENIKAPKIVIATGGKSYPATGSTGDGYILAKQAGHTIVEPAPALVPLEVANKQTQVLNGLLLKNTKASLWVANKKTSEAFGELLFTDFGLAGPIILTLSRQVVSAINQRQPVKIVLDLKTALDEQKLDARLQRDLNEQGKKQIEKIFKNWLPNVLIPYFLNRLQINPQKEGHQITAKERKGIRNLMKNLDFDISGYRSFKEAIITVGGVSTGEINPKTMESMKISGLYFAGEVLDLDANTGGYNLQIAWSTAYLAAVSAISN